MYDTIAALDGRLGRIGLTTFARDLESRRGRHGLDISAWHPPLSRVVRNMPQMSAAAQKVKRACGDAVAFAQSSHERRGFRVGQCRMMAGFPNLRAGRQQMVKVPTPTRWVFAFPIADGRCPIQDAFDPAANAPRRSEACCHADQGLL